jgi:sulfatase maturation enzyme AslB (radical SAM superfamily)
MTSKTYCAYPFVNASLQSDNTVLPCGQFMKASLFKNIIPIQQVRDGPVIQDMRKKMLSGEYVDGCQCHAEEAAGLESMRQAGIARYGHTTNTKLRRIEIVSDNVCNIKCRSCGSPYSHLWYEDEIALYGESLLGKKYSKNTLYTDVNLADLDEIEVLGGEPTVSPTTEDFFTRLRDAQVVENLTIKLSTNGMSLPKDNLLYGLENCKMLDLNISVDGYKKSNDYIRSGSTFETIEQSLEFYDKLITIRPVGSTIIKVHTAVSIYNINQLFLLNDYVSLKFPRFNKTIQMIQYPVYLNVRNTPDDFKQHIASIIHDKDILNYMFAQGTDLFGHFINFTQRLDEIRNEDISTANMWLAVYMSKYNNTISRQESKEFFLKCIDEIKNN